MARIETKCLHEGWAPKQGESRQLPICQSTTFKYDSSEYMGKLFDLEADGYFYYEIEYEEPTYDFYYRKDTDPTGYSYVKLDDEYGSVELIKMYAETVYSEGYLKGVYEMLFTGAAVSDDASGVRGARYYNYEDPEGRVWLMSADDYTPLVKEKRVYDMSTAKIVRPSNKNFVNIEIESYLESTPDVRVKVTLSMIKQDGVWMLDSATY